MLAAKDNQKEMTRILLKHKASVVAVDNSGYSALYLAAKYGNYEVVEIIQQEPLVDVSIKNEVSWRRLSVCVHIHAITLIQRDKTCSKL